MDFQQIQKTLAKIKSKKPKILVLGDVMLDQYINGKVDRISPEAPVPILKFQKKEEILGGAGNVVRNLVNLGAKVSIASIIGNGPNGILIKKLFSDIKVSTEFLYDINKVSTTRKTRFLSEGSQLLRLDNDTKGILKKHLTQLEEKIFKDTDYYDCIIISDYNKGVCQPSLIKKIIKHARRVQTFVFVDPKGTNWQKYLGADCLTPNTKEVERILGLKLKDNIDFEKAAAKLKKELKLKSCLITRGSDGMTFHNDAYTHHQRVGQKKVYDVSGAGDTVIASLAASFSSGVKISECLDFSSFVSSEVVAHVGTTPFHSSMILPPYS